MKKSPYAIPSFGSPTGMFDKRPYGDPFNVLGNILLVNLMGPQMAWQAVALKYFEMAALAELFWVLVAWCVRIIIDWVRLRPPSNPWPRTLAKTLATAKAWPRSWTSPGQRPWQATLSKALAQSLTKALANTLAKPWPRPWPKFWSRPWPRQGPRQALAKGTGQGIGQGKTWPR